MQGLPIAALRAAQPALAHWAHVTRISKTYTRLSRQPTTKLFSVTTADENTSPGSCSSPTTTPLDKSNTHIKPGTEHANTRPHKRVHSSQATAAKQGEAKMGRPLSISVSHARSWSQPHLTFLSTENRKQKIKRKTGYVDKAI